MLPWTMDISGSSSAGKSRLARAVAALAAPPTVIFETDTALPTVTGLAESGPTPPIVVFHRSLNTWSRAGYNLIVDGALPYGDPALRARCLAELADGHTVIIGVECSTGAELRRREVRRLDARLAGWAEQQARDVNAGLDLLITVDTATGTTDEHAVAVLLVLNDEMALRLGRETAAEATCRSATNIDESSG